MPNPTPIFRLTSVSVISDVTIFATQSTQPIAERFILEFDQSFTPSTNITEFAHPNTSDLPMVTIDGGNIRADMIAMAIQLRKFRALPVVQCNPYRFRVMYKTDPDRVIFCDPLPPSGYVPAPPATTEEINPQQAVQVAPAAFVPPVTPAPVTQPTTVTPVLL